MQCSARRRDGQQCNSFAIRGASTCRMHGSATQASRVRAAERVVEGKAMQVLQRQGVHTLEDPLSELSRLGGEVVAMRDLVGARIAQAKTLTGPEVALWERMADRCGRVLADIARLDLDNRLAKVNDATAALIVDAVDYGLRAAGMPEEKIHDGRVAAATRLRQTRPALDSPR